MNVDVVIPNDLWEEDSEGVITSWLASKGASVETGDLLAELMVEKVQYEIASPATGILSIIKAEDEIINRGDVIAQIEAG